jgi:hypothetical protein
MKQPKEILFARELKDGRLWHVQYTMDDDDGNEIVHSHVFPKETMDWRAAEYGFDPADTHTILYCILMEPWEEQAQSPQDSGGNHYCHTMTKDKAKAEKLKRNGYNKVKLQAGASTGKNLTDDPEFDKIHAAGLKEPQKLDEKIKSVQALRVHTRVLAARQNVSMVQLEHVHPAVAGPQPPPPGVYST